MPNFGNTTTPANTFFFDDFGNCNFASNVGSMPAGGGTLTDMYLYIAGDGASANVWFMIWDGSGGIIFESGLTSITSGTQSVGGQAWQHTTIPTPPFVAAGTSLLIGLWTSGHVVWTTESSGSVMFQRSVNSGGQVFNSGGTEGGGAFGAYVTYTAGGSSSILRVNTGTPASPVWTAGTGYINQGTPASPNLVANSSISVNTGTAAAPVWTATT